MSKSRTFASLAIYNYAWFFSASLISNIGSWMARIAQGWLVLTILTNDSATALGFVTALQFLPLPLLSPLAGALVDRFSKRQILLWTQISFGLASGLLAGLVITGNCALWQVYILAAVQGTINAFDNPGRAAFISEMVPESLLANAVALNSITFNASRLLGPAVSGFAIAVFGVGPVLLINAFTYLPTVVALLAMRSAELHPAPQQKGKGIILEGIRYIKNHPMIMLLMFIAFMLGTFGMNFQLTNVLIARQAFGLGAEAYGLLGSAMAVGTLAASLWLASREEPRIENIIRDLIGFTIAVVLVSASPWFWLYAILLIPVGYFSISVLVCCSSAVQLATAPEFRGRVMALYMAVFMGGTPVGAPVIGWIGDILGARASVLIGAVATGITVVIAILLVQWRNRRRELVVKNQ